MRFSFLKLFGITAYRSVLVIHMKSGKSFKIPYDTVEWTINQETGCIESYHFVGYKISSVRFMNVNEIEFISQESYSIFKRY